MQQQEPSSKGKLQLVWGIALALAGVGVFVRIPQVMPKIAQIEIFSTSTGIIRICFYLMGIILLGGGIQKIYRYVIASKPDRNS